MKPSVLVTGGAGYIGSHCCKALSQAGFEPVTYDNMLLGHRELVNWGPLEEGDILDAERLDAVITRHSPVAIMHFAALTAVEDSMYQPLKYWENNVQGSMALFQAMQRAGVNTLVFSSSAAVYGAPENGEVSEDSALKPVNPYGWTKLAVEQLLESISSSGYMNYVALRYFNAAGADPDGELGEIRDKPSHLIPLVLAAVGSDSAPLNVHGDDYPTPDGTCVRDYIHVSDLADAHVKALQFLLDKGPSQAFNLSNGAGYSVKEVIESASRVTGQEVVYQIGPRRVGDPAALVGNSDKARQILSWSPAHPELDTIIASTWQWFSKLKDLKNTT